MQMDCIVLKCPNTNHFHMNEFQVVLRFILFRSLAFPTDFQLNGKFKSHIKFKYNFRFNLHLLIFISKCILSLAVCVLNIPWDELFKQQPMEKSSEKANNSLNLSTKNFAKING